MSITLQDAMLQVRDVKRRLEGMAQELPFSEDDKAKRALEHAAAWLGDITEPLTEAERARWEGDDGLAALEVEALSDDKTFTLAQQIVGDYNDADIRYALEVDEMVDGKDSDEHR